MLSVSGVREIIETLNVVDSDAQVMYVLYTTLEDDVSTLRRTQMYFPEDMLTELRLVASARNESVSEVVRDAVASFLEQKNSPAKNWEADPLWDMVGSGNSGLSDGSLNHDYYLYGKSK
jgi:hypothetical protein